MATYPSELPNPLRGGFTRSQVANTIRSSVDVGEAKVRRRYTLAIYSETWSLALDPTALSFFDNWFNNTLKSGVLRFQHVDPITNSTHDYRVVDMPSYKPFGTCGSYSVSFSVERLP